MTEFTDWAKRHRLSGVRQTPLGKDWTRFDVSAVVARRRMYWIQDIPNAVLAGDLFNLADFIAHQRLAAEWALREKAALFAGPFHRKRSKRMAGK